MEQWHTLLLRKWTCLTCTLQNASVQRVFLWRMYVTRFSRLKNSRKTFIVMRIVCLRCYVVWTPQFNANGPDSISARMFKFTAFSIAPSITKILNLSIRLGKLFEIWKPSYVIPIPKSPNTQSPCKYWPIFLLCTLGKVLEKHICTVMFSHLDNYHPLPDIKWGFRPVCSTVTALLSTVNNWLELWESSREICPVFLDYRKAFDNVPHGPLVVKHCKN